MRYEEGLLDYVKFPRSWLADHGVDMYFSTLAIGQFIVDGGTSKVNEGTVSYDLQVYLDSAKLGLWNGGHALVRIEGKGDSGVNLFTGALIPVNFDGVVPTLGPTGIEATEWWIAQEFLGGKAEALFGMWDIGRFFDIVPFSGPYSDRFLNAHMFFNNVLSGGGYAPYNSLGGMVTLQPVEWLTVRTAISDPNSSAIDVDFWGSGELIVLHEWKLKARPFGRPGWFTAGLGYQTLPSGSAKDSDWAVFLNFNQWLYQDPKNPHRAFGLFGRVGITDGKVNPVKTHVSLGISFDGMIPSRPNDLIGIVGWYNNISGAAPPGSGDSSAGIEAYYRIEVFPWLQVSPDLQFLIEPALDPTVDNTVILGLRALVLL